MQLDLNIPQLRLAKIAQLGKSANTKSKHHSPRVAGSISVGGNFFVEIILL